MSKKDYTKQVEKRQRIKETTLVVGVDIGREYNAVGFMNKDGEVLRKSPKVYNSREGFDYFVRTIEEVKAKYGLKDVLIGLEPTGHYWRKLAYFAKDRGYAVQFVRTTALKHQRELDESSSAKSDMKDALTITNITREGKYIDTVIKDGIFRQLRTVCKVRERIKRYNVSSKNTLTAALDDYFPELRKIFWSTNSRGLWALLERCAFPEDVLAVKVSTIEGIIARSSRRRKTAAQKALDLYQAAKESIGLKQVGSADRYRVKMCLAEVKRTEGLLKEIEKEIKELLKQISYAEYMLSIPGIGAISTAIFFGELGNPEYFQHARQIVKYAGYDPQEKDSGQRIGRKIISKKGRWLLRKSLFYMSMRVVVQSKYFKEYYHRKLETKNKFGHMLRKKEALCAVVIKLINVIFALLRDRRRFDHTVRCFPLAA
jgi:transposase